MVASGDRGNTIPGERNSRGLKNERPDTHEGRVSLGGRRGSRIVLLRSLRSLRRTIREPPMGTFLMVEGWGHFYWFLTFPDFKVAGTVHKVETRPEWLWKASDMAQFKWLEIGRAHV